MEQIHKFNYKIILAIIMVLSIIGITLNSMAGTKLYTEGLNKGDILSFTENNATAWNVYKSKKNALKTTEDKSVKAVKYLKKGDKIKINLVSSKYENVLGIDLIRDGKTTAKYGYIHYGSDAEKYFKKVENNNQTKITIKLNKTSLMLGAGEIYKLKATVKPVGTKVTWESSNTNFAKVDKNGKVTINNKEILNKNGIKDGDKVIITAKAGNSVATCEIERIAISVGKMKVKEKFNYTNRADFEKIVQNETPNILEVQNDGKTIKAKKAGIGKIIWQNKDGAFCKTVWYVQTKAYNQAFYNGRIYEVNKDVYCDTYTKYTNKELESGEHYWHLREGDKFQIIAMDGNWVKIKIVSVTPASKKYFKEGEKYYIFVSDNTDDVYFTYYAWEQV